VNVDASGAFTATVALGGSGQIVVTAKNPSNGESFTISIPLSVAGPGGVISEPLAVLRQGRDLAHHPARRIHRA
jgi:hypothetical protein